MPSQVYQERKNERARQSSRDASKRAASIGELHPVQNPRRRHLCSMNLGLWLQTYYPHSTGLGPFSRDHYAVIDSIEHCLLRGGWYANAVYREFAKTSIAEGSAQWALCNGHKRFGAVFGADEDAASEIVDSIGIEFKENDLLWEDFPEICIAFRHLEGRHQRCKSQEYDGQLTHIDCVGEQIVLPSIRLSPEQSRELGIPVDRSGYTLSSGGVLVAKGLMCASRGMKHKRPDGTQQRPDFAIIDDPLTDRAADSPAEISKRIRIIRKAIIPLAGQRQKLSIVCNGTTITTDDVMEQLLDSKVSPGWLGRRIPMLKSFAKNEKLWDEYGRLLMTWDREKGEAAQMEARKRALDFYVANRQTMDDGADATWHTCFSPDQHEISAIQHAYTVMYEQGKDVFDTEAQQKPKRRGANGAELKMRTIIDKADGTPQGVAPIWANGVTVFADVQDNALFWLALAYGEGFKAHVVDYGIYPEQAGSSLFYENVKRRLRDEHPGTMEAALLAGLKHHLAHHKASIFTRQDGTELPVSLVGGDSGDNSTIVYNAARLVKFIPTKGKYVGAKQTQWEDYPSRDGEEINRAYHYLLAPTQGSGGLRVLQFDTNWWKSFVMKRIRAAIGDPGSLTLFGDAQDHLDLAAHILSEYATEVTAKGKATVEEWALRPGQKENHLLDCLVGAFVLAAKCGAALLGMDAKRTPARPKRQGPIVSQSC